MTRVDTFTEGPPPCCPHPLWRHTPRCVDCNCSGPARAPEVERPSRLFESKAIPEGRWSAELRQVALEVIRADRSAANWRHLLDGALRQAHDLGAPCSQLQKELAAVGYMLTRAGVMKAIQRHRRNSA